MKCSDSVVLATWDPSRPQGAGGKGRRIVASAEDDDRGLVRRWVLESDNRPAVIPDGRLARNWSVTKEFMSVTMMVGAHGSPHEMARHFAKPPSGCVRDVRSASGRERDPTQNLALFPLVDDDGFHTNWGKS